MSALRATFPRTRAIGPSRLAVVVLAVGCHVRETRVTMPEADYAAQLVRSRVETREGQRRPTWKPIVLGIIAGATAGSVAMVWGGFLAPNRPLAVTGIVGAVTIPTLGSIPFLLEQDHPWTKTEWEQWQPVVSGKASLDVLGREVEPISTHALVSDAAGNVEVSLAQLCDAPRMGDLHLVDVVVRVPDSRAEVATTSIPVDRLPAPCGGGRLSLFHRVEPSPATDPAAEPPIHDHGADAHAQH